MDSTTRYTITYTIQTTNLEVQTLDADFALWLAVEQKQTFADTITAKELLQHYTEAVYELYQQEQNIKKILLL